jgi:hypothetical protein
MISGHEILQSLKTKVANNILTLKIFELNLLTLLVFKFTRYRGDLAALRIQFLFPEITRSPELTVYQAI